MAALGSRVGWYARRLRSMQPTEVAWRVRRLAQGAAVPVADRAARRRLPQDPGAWERMLADFRGASDRPVLLDRDRARRIAELDPSGTAGLVAAAERVVAGRVRYFGYPEVQLSEPVDWHHDPLRGYDWPRIASSRLDHRTAPADPKWVWELNRLQHLPWLAEAWLLTGREEFAETAFAHLESWLEQCPVGVGIAWRGAFEAGVRAISVLVALQGLRDSPLLTSDLFRRVVETMEASGRACWRERSLFSSANNHLVGEIAGLATIGLLLPELPRAARWVERAVALLSQEADLQLLPDGAGAEQAVGYQMFTAELLLVVLVLLRAGGRTEPERLAAGVRRSARYLAGVVGDGDPAPRYGDDDEGFALRLGPEEVRTVRDHLGIVAAYGAPEAEGAVAGGLTAQWYAAATRAGSQATRLVGDDPLPPSFLAPDGGLVVLRGGGERVTVDVGPLGYLSLAAHGHADALAVTWSIDGEEVVGDPGTGSYYGHPDWREVHRGTLVHPTVAVDDLDQSVIAGAFMWAERASVTRHHVDVAAGVVDAEHDGYTRLEEPVVHRRWVRAAPSEGGLLVVDVLEGRGRHRARVSWPLAPGLSGEPVTDGFLVRRAGRPVAQIASAGTAGLDHAAVVGDEVSHQGWWSERLEQRELSHLLFSTCEAAVSGPPLVVASVLRPWRDDVAQPVSGLTVSLEPGVAVVTWSEQQRHWAANVPIGPTRKHRWS